MSSGVSFSSLEAIKKISQENLTDLAYFLELISRDKNMKTENK